MRTLRPHAPALLAAALVTLFSWPVTGDLHPRLDLDGAWEIGLRQALHEGLDFGPEVLFTYGPLGFLREPLLVYPTSARLAFAWGILVQFTLALTLIWGLRHAFGSRVLAVLLAIPFAAALWQEPTLVLAFFGAVVVAAGRVHGRGAQGVALALGVLSGIELLSKLNAGVTVVALGAIAIAAAPSPRRALVAPFAGGTLAALVVGWVATGQSFGGIDDFVTGSMEIVSGYSEAMRYEDELTAWEPVVGAALCALGLLVAWRAADLLPRRARLGLLALWAVLAFTTFKAGFVRHDPSHSNIFFASLLGGMLAFAWAPHRRQTAALLGAVFAVALIGSANESPRELFAPLERTDNFLDQAKVLAGNDLDSLLAGVRDERVIKEQLDARLRAQAMRGTVHVEPLDTGLVWAQGLRWGPLPVFQGYSAYTRELDERNAAAVRSPDGPDRILRESGMTFDDRNPNFDSPAAIRETLCHFRPFGEPLGRWILLERTEPRCGRERPLATVEARLGEPAQIPPAPDDSSVVVMRIEGIEVAGLEKLRTALFRAVPRSVTLDGNRTFPFVPGTAEDGLVMRVPEGADFPEPFGLDQESDHITVTKAGREGDLTLRFSAMSIR